MDRLLATGEDRIDSTTKTDIGNDRMVSELLTLHFTASTVGLNVFSMHKTEQGKHPMYRATGCKFQAAISLFCITLN